MPSSEALGRLIGTPETGGTFQVLINTSPVSLSSSPVKVKSVTIKSDKNNTDTVYLGFSNSIDESNGFAIDPGEHIDIIIDDLSKIYAVSSSTAQKLYVLWVR